MGQIVHLKDQFLIKLFDYRPISYESEYLPDCCNSQSIFQTVIYIKYSAVFYIANFYHSKMRIRIVQLIQVGSYTL